MKWLSIATFVSLISTYSSADIVPVIHYILGTQAEITRAAAEIQKKWCVELYVNDIEDHFSGRDEDGNGYINDSTGWDLVNKRPAQKQIYAPLFLPRTPPTGNIVKGEINDAFANRCSRAVPVVSELPADHLLAISYIRDHYLLRTLREDFARQPKARAVVIIHFREDLRTEMKLLMHASSIAAPPGTLVQIEPHY